MAVWGMGSFFNGADNQFDNFIKENFVCMLWNENDVPEFYAMMKEIQLGDIIYLKSFKRGSDEMHVNAVGIVTETFKNKNNPQKDENTAIRMDEGPEKRNTTLLCRYKNNTRTI